VVSDDIVTRLRTSYNASLVTCELLPDEIEDMKEAADEIEQLRKWKELAYDIRNGWFGIPRKYEMKFRELHNADWEKVRNG